METSRPRLSSLMLMVFICLKRNQDEFRATLLTHFVARRLVAQVAAREQSNWCSRGDKKNEVMRRPNLHLQEETIADSAALPSCATNDSDPSM